jgi:hypothetical protein
VGSPRQVGTGKASVSEPLMTCRNALDGIKTGAVNRLRDEPGGCPLIGQAVSGMEAARVRSAASARNVGRHVPILPGASWWRVGREGVRLAAETVRR